MNKTPNLPEKLKELRTAHSYTQDYVACAIGVVRQTYSHYETGRRTPDAEAMYKLAGLYNIPLDEFLRYSFADIDRNESYDAPTPTEESKYIEAYLAFLNDPSSHKKLQFLTNDEKELLFYYDLIYEKDDKQELIEIAKLKARKKQ